MKLEEWFEKYEATRLLKENLEANMHVLCHKLTEEQKKVLLKMNMTVIRQAMQECGVE